MCAAQYAATFSNWLAINEPNIWSRTKKVVMLPTYIHYKLLGKLCDSVANQVGHVPFNYKKNGVDSARLTAVGRGGSQPVVARSDKDNWWKNRRVEFILNK